MGDTAASYGSSVKSKIPDTTFDDVKGLEDVKKIVESFVFMAENPQIMKHYRLEGGLGMMMYGAPGTGKTMFAEALANKLQLPLFIVTPADIYKSYVG
ncbi:MAG: ATP-binding protein, partial [Clostridia bacterium]|nr:ATP-binding protein [Clostridia bacterium]